MKNRSSYHIGDLRPKLLKEAGIMLAEVGPNKLSIRAVSERVGVSATATYHHFSNKNALVCELAAQGFRKLGHSLKQCTLKETAMDTLSDGCVAYFDFALKNPALYQLMFSSDMSPEKSTEVYQQARDEAFGELRRIVALVIENDEHSTEVLSSSLSCWSFTHGLASLAIQKQFPFEKSEADHLVLSAISGLQKLF